MSDDEFRKRVFVELKQFFDDRLPELRRIRKGRPVRSIQAVNWFIRMSKERGWGLDNVQYGVSLDEHHTKRRIEHYLFQDQLIQGLAGVTELSDELTATMRQFVTAGLNLKRLLPQG